jgi:hypothetical protein
MPACRELSAPREQAPAIIKLFEQCNYFRCIDVLMTAASLCGSDELKLLQQIADSVVDELSQTPDYKAADRIQLFHRVGKQVFKSCDGGDLLSVDEIKREVLAKFQG